jgi:Holliday junction resolvasome RuvABC endonuclease subunit
MSFDPGLNNFAYSVIKNGKVIDCGFINDTVNDLRSEVLKDLTKKFYKKIKSLIKLHKPNLIIAERFMVRAKFLGASAEKISFMMGIVAQLAYRNKIEFELVTSALWKNRFNREIGKNELNIIYKKIKPILPHVIDSTFIGLYIVGPYTDKSVEVAIKQVRYSWIKSTNVQLKR